MKPRVLFISLTAWGVLFSVAGVLLYFALHTPLHPPQWRIDIGSSGDEFFVADFFSPEHNADQDITFRWSSPDARFLLHGASTRATILTMRLHHGTEEGPFRRLLVEHAARTIASFDMLEGWRTYAILMPPGTTVGNGLQTQPLNIRSSRYHTVGNDERWLGVPVDMVTLQPLRGDSQVATVTLQRVLILLWGLALLAGFLSLAAPVPWAKQAQPTPARLRMWPQAGIMAVVGLATAAMLAWARYAPHTLALVLPHTLWVWVLGTLVLLSGWRWNAGRRTWMAGGVGLWGVAHTLLLLPLPVPVEWPGIATFTVMTMPGALLALLLFGSEQSTLLRLFLALCGGIALQVPMMLLIQALPGPPPRWLPLLVSDALIAGLAYLLYRAAQHNHPSSQAWRSRQENVPDPAARMPASHVRLLVLLLCIGAGLRWLHLGGAEFQGDESHLVLMATGLAAGQDDILLTHKKGPVEILLPAEALVVTNHLNEWVARFPFALAGMGVLIGTYLLTRYLASTMLSSNQASVAGLVAAAILALDGFSIAFSRITQYQSIVMLMTPGALWCCWRFYQGVAQPQRYLVSAAVLAATGILAHYDGLYALPAMAWLVLAGCRRHNRSVAGTLRTLVLPTTVGIVLLLSFYLPFVLHDHFSKTYAYLVESRIATEEATALLHNNLPGMYYELAAFYNTTFQVHWLALMLVVALAGWVGAYTRPRLAGMLILAWFLAGCALLVVHPEHFAMAGIGNGAILVIAVPLAALIFSPTTPAALRTLLLWFGIPFMLMAFVIANPKTHFYTAHSAAAPLIGLGLVHITRWLSTRRLTWLAVLPIVSGGLVVVLAIPYLSILFVRQVPEYYRTFPHARPDIYRASYGDMLNQEGYFGFPHRDGWKVIGMLYRQGALQGTYNSQQKPEIVGWYAHDAFRCTLTPDYWFIPLFALDPETTPQPYQAYQPENYDLEGMVIIDGRRTLLVFGREPVNHQPWKRALSDYIEPFDTQPVGSFPIQRMLKESPLRVVPQHELNAGWQRNLLLHGYDLYKQQVQPGEMTPLSLYWQITAANTGTATPLQGYELVVEILDANGTVIGRADPLCNPPPPAVWDTSHYFIETSFSITADSSLPPGTYTLRAGLRQHESGAWLPRADGSLTLSLATIEVTGYSEGSEGSKHSKHSDHNENSKHKGQEIP